MTPNTKIHLFLYGTLMRGCHNHRHIEDQQFVGEAHTVPGYQLHDLTGYPGMVAIETEPSVVEGELWLVDADCLARLNRFEGIDTGLYELAPIRLHPPYHELDVMTYLYLKSTKGREVIPGSWTEEP